MRRRAKRDLAILAGIVIVIGVAFFANYMLNLGKNVTFFTKMREEAEKQRLARGYELLSWKTVTATEWTRGGGPTFTDELKARNDQPVDIVGFMVPIDRYRDMTDFLLLPLPIECYFCEMPPREHVVLVQMAEGKKTNRFKEPVLINGRLKLQEGGKAKFFYIIENADLASAKEGGKLTEERINLEHFTPDHMQEKVQPVLQPGYEPPGS